MGSHQGVRRAGWLVVVLLVGTAFGVYGQGTVAPAFTPAGELILPTDSCYACHVENTAVENSFVQYYPALFEAAKKYGTVKSTYDPNKRF